MSQSTKTLRQPRSGRSRVGGTSQPVTGTASASALQSVFDRALQMGRFRFGWSADQRSFLRSEIALWSSDHCLQLGEEITGVSDRLVWELLPLEQAALSVSGCSCWTRFSSRSGFRNPCSRRYPGSGPGKSRSSGNMSSWRWWSRA